MTFASLSDAYWLDTPLLTRPAERCVLCDLLRGADDAAVPGGAYDGAPASSPFGSWGRTVLLVLALTAIVAALLSVVHGR
ncbi:hypothetical protein [Streptomyces sp. NPDC048111]|uniref:hypothetical protein n=1 Tax=Streptomyces sp. NPDC048111 TaxID=3365500 RepID=UPI003721584D